MKRAMMRLRPQLHYRRDLFTDGLQAAGYDVQAWVADPRPDDVLVIWNRYGESDIEAKRFEKAGARALVIENGYLGKEFRGGPWFSMAVGHHAGAGTWREGDGARWDALGIELEPWHVGGSEVVIIGQRGIGENGIASPTLWAERTLEKFGGRIRKHPGKTDPAVSLRDDLRDAISAITWASTAGLHALILGVPVWYEMKRWIGGAAARHVSEYGRSEPKRDDDARLAMFRRLAWAMFNANEIQSGFAFAHLLKE